MEEIGKRAQQTLEAVNQLQQYCIILNLALFLVFHTFGLSLPTERVDDAGNRDHRRDIPLLDSHPTKASYLKTHLKTQLKYSPVLQTVLSHIISVVCHVLVRSLNN